MASNLPQQQAFSEHSHTGFLVTELDIPLFQPQDKNKLLNYIDNIDKKFQYAEWKQNLILKYNYMPLANIKEKIQRQQQAYFRRMHEEEQRAIRKVQSVYSLEDLAKMKVFKEKLEAKVQEFQRFMVSRKNLNIELRRELKEKRNKLKMCIKENMILSRQQLQNAGIKSKSDIQNLLYKRNSKLSKTRGNSLASISENYWSIGRQRTSRQLKKQKQTHYKSQKISPINSSQTLYKQCLATYLNHIKQTHKKNTKKTFYKLQQQFNDKIATKPNKIDFDAELTKNYFSTGHKSKKSVLAPETKDQKNWKQNLMKFRDNWEQFRKLMAQDIAKLFGYQNQGRNFISEIFKQ